MSPHGGLRTYSSRKAPSELRKTYFIKLSSEEHIAILKKAIEAGLPMSEYIRLKALDGVLNKKERKIRSIPPHFTEA